MRSPGGAVDTGRAIASSDVLELTAAELR